MEILKKIKLFLISSLIFISNNMVAQLLPKDIIYRQLDNFIATANAENLENLKIFEQQFYKNSKPKSNDELLALIILSCNIGYYCNQFGQLQNAIASYEQALQIYNSNLKSKFKKQFDIVVNCLQPLGNLYTKIGDYNNAENIIKQYYQLAFKNKNTAVSHAAILNLSIVYQQSGRIDLSNNLLQDMLTSNQLTVVEKANYQAVLGNNYLLQNKNVQAEKAILNSIKILQNQKNKTLELSNCYKNLSSIYYQKKDYKLSQDYFETALRYKSETFGLGSYLEAKDFFEYAVLLLKMGNWHKADDYLTKSLNNLIAGFVSQNKALPSQNQLYADTILIDVLDLKATIFKQQNQLQKALQTYELCSYIDDLFDCLIVDENSKIINQVRAKNRIENSIAICIDLFKKTQRQQYALKAFLLSDKTKSGVLKKYLLANKKMSSAEKVIQQKIQNINNQIIKEQQKINFADLDKISQLIIEQNQHMLQLKSIKKKEPLVADNWLDTKALFIKLHEQNATLIEYFFGQNTIYLFIVNNDKIDVKIIDYNTINKNKIIRYIELFTVPDAIENNISNYKLVAYDLFKLLQIPILTTQNLIIIPDGLLNFVSFDALLTLNVATDNFANLPYLLKNNVVAYSNSASFYIDAKPLISDNTVLGIFPVFAKTDYELAASKTEMNAIKKQFEGFFFENQNANFKNFKTHFQAFSILHLSTHADGGNVDEPATIKFFDQDVLYSELYNLDLKPNLVVLSACQTGIGKLYQSEGAMSVARGFQMAGAQNLLFSLWKVNDYTTALLMGDFYKNINKKMSFAAANQQSKLDFLANKTISNTKKSPYYWAAFVYYGTLEKPTSYFWIWVLVGLFAIIVAIYL